MKPTKLTKSVVEALEARGARYEIHDSTLPGFVCRVGIKGDKSLYYLYRAGKGRSAPKRRLLLGTFPTITIEQARQMAKAKAAAVALGNDPAQERAEGKKALTVAEALAEFLAEYVDTLCKPNTQEQYKTLARNDILPALGKRKVEAVTNKDIYTLHHSLRKFPAKANRVAAVLSSFFSWCERTGYRQQNTNPVRGLKKNTETPKQEFLSAEQLAAIGGAVDALEQRREITPTVAAALRVLMLTGARKMEILPLKWSYLDLDKGVATLPDSKTGFKVLQIPAAAVEVLRSMPRLSDEYVFPSSKDGSKTGHLCDVKHIWKRVLKAAGVGHWRPHDLRHGLASVMVNSGASLPFIGAILGHKKTQTTARYAHIAENPARAALEKAVAQIINNEPHKEEQAREAGLH